MDRIAGGKAADQSMKQGKGAGATKGSRSSFIGNGVPSNVNGLAVVTAGTVTGGTGPAKGGSVTASAPAFKGQDAAKTLVPSGTKMKEGKGAGAKKGIRGSFGGY